MVEPPEDQDVQTMTAVGKLLVTDDSTALLLGLPGYSATKLWNAAMRYTKERGESTGKNWGDSGNQQFHKWPFDRVIKMITYKARLRGIIVVAESEEYTSQTCCMCGTKRKAGRIHRGLYVCNQCGAVINADVNGVIDILKRDLPEQVSVSWSSGCLAQPAVNRFA